MRLYEPLAGVAPTALALPVSTWLRRAIETSQTLEDAAIASGAIGALDAIVRRQERWAGAWRFRRPR
ncbi:hypothetical protein X741_32320 [Mesorhizobium sp. LNHC229A00]|nr:hypothetical protein X741_32320 [Mesorhizobium sp. LNHC229A00]